jgi:hypothetical protein
MREEWLPSRFQSTSLGRDREAVQRYPTTAKIFADKHRIEARRGRDIANGAAARKMLKLVYYELRDGDICALDCARAA